MKKKLKQKTTVAT